VYRRGRRKIIADYSFEDIYKFYKEQYGDEALPRGVVKEIYKRVFPEIVKLIIFETLDYHMPARLGYIKIKKRKVMPTLNEDGELDVHKLSINWKKTKRLWMKLYPDKTAEEIKQIPGKPVIRELNEHTDGYRFKWFWDKTTSNVKNQTAYYIDMTRSHDKMLAVASRTNNLNFYL